MFCREMVSDVAKLRGEIERMGTRVVFVHMSNEELAAPFFEGFGVGDLARVADPQRELYEALDLKRAHLSSLLGPKTMLGAFRALAKGHRQGQAQGDTAQLPGVFLVVDGEVVKAHRSTDPSQVPDYLALARSDRS